MLCKAFKVDRPDLVDIYTERPPKYADSVSRLHVIFNDSEVKSPRSAMYQEGFIIRQVDDTYYAINFKEHILITLNEEGFDVERVKKTSKKQNEMGGLSRSPRRRSTQSRICSRKPIKDWVNFGKKVSAVTVPTANGRLEKRPITMMWMMDVHLNGK